MPVSNNGRKPRNGGKLSYCKGHRLDETHDELACHAQGEKRNDVIRLLNCWIKTIEGDCSVKKKTPEEPCREYVLCYPQFKCAEGVPDLKKIPLCVKGGVPASLIPETNCYQEKPLWKLDGPPPIPVWERPRVKSSQLIGGDFKKVKECFRANGLNDFDYCPRTESCQLMRCLNEMVEADRRIQGPEAIASDCCCRPGDAPSRMPQYKCSSCEPPSRYGHKNMNCPAEIGRHGEHHKHHRHEETCPHAYHLGDKKPGQPNHSYKQHDLPPNRVLNCLGMNNPRNSGEMWKDDLNIFGPHN